MDRLLRPSPRGASRGQRGRDGEPLRPLTHLADASLRPCSVTPLTAAHLISWLILIPPSGQAGGGEMRVRKMVPMVTATM